MRAVDVRRATWAIERSRGACMSKIEKALADAFCALHMATQLVETAAESGEAVSGEVVFGTLVAVSTLAIGTLYRLRRFEVFQVMYEAASVAAKGKANGN
jgi:hypothetical protein